MASAPNNEDILTYSNRSVPGRAPLSSTQYIFDYDVFDYEDESTEEEAEEDADERDGVRAVNSDFNVLRLQDTDIEANDEQYSFDSFDTGERFIDDPEGKTIDLIMENERHDEVSIAPGVV